MPEECWLLPVLRCVHAWNVLAPAKKWAHFPHGVHKGIHKGLVIKCMHARKWLLPLSTPMHVLPAQQANVVRRTFSTRSVAVVGVLGRLAKALLDRSTRSLCWMAPEAATTCGTDI